jgi:DNA-binding MarR family transcriptional regulator
VAELVLTSIEKRVLAYLDQRGPTHRERVVSDLASPESMIGRRGGRTRGSNGATPLIMGAWCRRLIKAGFVRHVRSDDRFWGYMHHAITAAGRVALRESADA